MAGIKLEGFQGLVPRTSPRLLPVMTATTARNTKLLQGELRGFRALREVADLTDQYFDVQRVFRVRDSGGFGYGDTWLAFDSKNVDVVRSPIVNDQFDRYYWAGDGRPQYNTSFRIFEEEDSYFLGIPTPTVAPTVTPPVGSDSTRAYVYTFLSAFGEEGPPSPPTLATGDGAGTWALSGMQTVVPDAADRNVTLKRIYRTVPGNSSSTFFFVAEIPVGDATYNDNETDDVVAANNVLESTTWEQPPTDIEGWVVMPGGYLVAWAGRRLLFSEPYRPHAWPPEYELSTEFPIKGLVVWGTTLIIGTESQPYMGQGQHPASFTMQKMDAVEPCLSRRGMVATVAGAYYPSINGLALVNSNGVQIITQDILTKEEWARYNPSDIFAAQLGLQYIAFNSESFGFVFNPTEPATKLVELDRFDNVLGIETDKYSGNVLILSQNRVWDWDPEDAERLFWRWKSKVFQTQKPVNFGAARINFEAAENDVTDDILTYYLPYNEARFAAAPLNTLGGHCLCGPAQGVGLVPGWTEPELRMPLGGDLLYPINFMLFQLPAVRLIVYCGSRGVVLDTVVNSERIVRIPAGFKSDLWQFELIGNTNVYSLQVAETAKGLATV
jgi:hypothetical protein